MSSSLLRALNLWGEAGVLSLRGLPAAARRGELDTLPSGCIFLVSHVNPMLEMPSSRASLPKLVRLCRDCEHSLS